MSEDLKALFAGIMAAKPATKARTAKLPLGTHVVAVKKYAARKLDGNGSICTLDCVVMQTNNPAINVGETREWAWFPGSDKWGKESGRAQQFIVSVGAGVGDLRDGIAIGETLVDGTYEGVLVKVSIAQAFEKDGQTPKMSGKGNQIFDIEWFPVPNQTIESIQAGRAQMAQYAAAPPAPSAFVAAPVQTAPVVAAPVAAPVQAAPGFGGFPQHQPTAPFATTPAFAPAAPSAQPAPAAPAPLPANNPLAGLLNSLKRT